MNLKLSKTKMFLVITIIILVGLITAGEKPLIKIKKSPSVKTSDNSDDSINESIEFKEVDQEHIKELMKKSSDQVSLQVDKLISEEKVEEENKLTVTPIEDKSIKDKLIENLKIELKEKKIEKKDNLDLKIDALISAPEESNDVKNNKIKLMINKE